MRAVQVLEAFTEAVVVVVAVDRDRTPTVLTVRAPTRRLSRNRALTLGRPRARMLIDLLMPSADADRQVQINLPDGVSLDVPRHPTPPAHVTIEVRWPQPFHHLRALMTQLLGPEASHRPMSLQQCLADLAAVKAEAARDALRLHEVRAADDPDPKRDSDPRDLTREVSDWLGKLHAQLHLLSANPATPSEALAALRETWQDRGSLPPLTLRRRTSADTLSPRAVVARADALEDLVQRAASPTDAHVSFRVAVTDAEFFSIARFAGGMSFLLTLVVAGFFAIAIFRPKGSERPSAEVLFGALTLFSAILAGRIQLPDRSTLRGLLSATGNWLIVASILPTVLLAVALAFYSSPWQAVLAAGVAMAAQLVLQLVMWRGPLSDTGSSRRPPRRLLQTGPAPDYARAHVLSSDWWRSTTAEALMIGRQAYGYVVWQHGENRSLTRLLVDAQQASPPIQAAPPGTRRLVAALLSQLGREPRSAAASRPPPAATPSA